MVPLIVKAIINFGKHKSAAQANGTKPPGIGRGIGLAVAAFFLIIVTSICQHQVRLLSFSA